MVFWSGSEGDLISMTGKAVCHIKRTSEITIHIVAGFIDRPANERPSVLWL